MQLPLAISEKIDSDFAGSSLILVGCAADNCKKDYCEFNIAVYPASGKNRLIDYGKDLYAIHPVKDARKILAEPHILLYDREWNFARLNSPEKRKEAFNESMREAERLASYHMINSYRFLERKLIKASSICFVAAVSSLSQLMLMKNKIYPHPSHIASQLRKESMLSELADAVSFDTTSLTNATRRMEKVANMQSKESSKLIVRKMKGLIDEGKIFDSLFYSYYWISKMLTIKKDGSEIEKIAEILSLSDEENELREKLDKTTAMLKGLLKHPSLIP